jgi:hypothetical protein
MGLARRRWCTPEGEMKPAKMLDTSCSGQGTGGSEVPRSPPGPGDCPSPLLVLSFSTQHQVIWCALLAAIDSTRCCLCVAVRTNLPSCGGKAPTLRVQHLTEVANPADEERVIPAE